MVYLWHMIIFRFIHLLDFLSENEKWCHCCTSGCV